jgi:hypothetical protein
VGRIRYGMGGTVFLVAMMAIASCTAPQRNTSSTDGGNQAGGTTQGTTQPVAAVIKGLDNPFFPNHAAGN